MGIKGHLVPLATVHSLFGIIDLDPVVIRIFKVDPLHSIHAGSDRAFCSAEVLKFDLMFGKSFYKFFHGRNSKTDVIILWMRQFFFCSFNQVQM